MVSSIRQWTTFFVAPLIAGLFIGISLAPVPVQGDSYEYDCGDQIDNDSDTLTDCEDIEDCSLSASCEEICDNQIDDDGDNAIDCADIYCWFYDPSCS